MEKGKILVIDDEREIVSLLEDILTSQSYEVVSATNGKDALRSLEKTKPDLIILDLVMPKGGGISFYHSIVNRSTGSTRYPVLVLTGRSEYEIIFHDLKVDGFMTKPFQIPQLLEKIEKILQTARQKKSGVLQPASDPAAVSPEHPSFTSGCRNTGRSAEQPPPPASRTHPFKRDVLIKEIMTPHVLTAHVASATLGMNEKPSDKLSDIAELLRVHKIRHVPVVDAQNKLLGLISEDNILRHLTPKRVEDGYEFDKGELDELILEHVMTRDPVTVHPDDPITRAIDIMAREKYGAIPVVDKENTLVGIVSQIDFLKLLNVWLE